MRAQFVAPSTLTRAAYPFSRVTVGALNAIDRKAQRNHIAASEAMMHGELVPPAAFLQESARQSARLTSRIERRTAWLARQRGNGPQARA